MPVDPAEPAAVPSAALAGGPVDEFDADTPPPPGLVPLLPHRVPAPPDVPDVPDYDDDEIDDADLAPQADVDGPELSRIASGLRDDQSPAEPPADLDVSAVLEAVRHVPGVANAQLRGNPGGMHTLRLDLADGADPGRVSRQVARLLKERMGLAAEPRRRNESGQASHGAAASARTLPPTSTPAREPRESTARDSATRDSATRDSATREPVPRESAARGQAVRGQAVRGQGAREPVARESADREPSARDSARDSGGSPGASDTAGQRAPFPRPRPATLTDMTTGASGNVTTGSDLGNDVRLTPPRVVVDQVRVSTLGSEATVEVRLTTGGVPSVGAATGPAVDGYLLRLAAQAAASAIDGLVEATPDAPQMRCFIDHAGVVPFGSCVVAVVVVLVTGVGWVEQLVGSALVGGDPRQAIVRATLAAMNRRLESLLA